MINFMRYYFLIGLIPFTIMLVYMYVKFFQLPKLDKQNKREMILEIIVPFVLSFIYGFVLWPFIVIHFLIVKPFNKWDLSKYDDNF
jgi:hypothetical protein